MSVSHDPIVVLGGGLSGLAAGQVLADAGRSVTVCERDSVVGGLSRTIERNGFRFDLGGHRFHTSDSDIHEFVRELMGDELITVCRSSKIYLRGKYFDYPLRPLNAMFGLGISTTARIIADYLVEILRGAARSSEIRSLEDWVVSNFGRTMFTIYFKEYSEKVWGIGCDRISAAWVAQRIRGLSLAKAIQHAFFRFSGRNLATLTDRFLYPRRGIGRLAERLREEIERSGSVLTDAEVLQVDHHGGTIRTVRVRHQGAVRTLPGASFVSSIPLTSLVRRLRPEPPDAVRQAAEKLRFRDLVIVAIMTKRDRITDQTWIYIPEKRIPFGRIHEPTNWSREMAPPGHSLLVIEYFSFRGDGVWRMNDRELTDITMDHLAGLGFLSREDCVDAMVVRVPQAYPLFEIGYSEHAAVLSDYFENFQNLEILGRNGMFQYLNMDAALRSGIDTAAKILQRSGRTETRDEGEPLFADTHS